MPRAYASRSKTAATASKKRNTRKVYAEDDDDDDDDYHGRHDEEHENGQHDDGQHQQDDASMQEEDVEDAYAPSINTSSLARVHSPSNNNHNNASSSSSTTRAATRRNSLRKTRSRPLPTIKQHSKTTSSLSSIPLTSSSSSSSTAAVPAAAKSKVASATTATPSAAPLSPSPSLSPVPSSSAAAAPAETTIRTGPRPRKSTAGAPRIYKCAECPKAFGRVSDKIRHERTHTNEKPYVCDVCEKAFIQLSALKVHERTHTGEKPYHCPVCPKTFADSSSLVRHRRVHSGERPYACKIKNCKRSFCRNVTLLKHQFREHGLEACKENGKPYLSLAPPVRKPGKKLGRKPKNVKKDDDHDAEQNNDGEGEDGNTDGEEGEGDGDQYMDGEAALEKAGKSGKGKKTASASKAASASYATATTTTTASKKVRQAPSRAVIRRAKSTAVASSSTSQSLAQSGHSGNTSAHTISHNANEATSGALPRNAISHPDFSPYIHDYITTAAAAKARHQEALYRQMPTSAYASTTFMDSYLSSSNPNRFALAPPAPISATAGVSSAAAAAFPPVITAGIGGSGATRQDTPGTPTSVRSCFSAPETSMTFQLKNNNGLNSLMHSPASAVSESALLQTQNKVFILPHHQPLLQQQQHQQVQHFAAGMQDPSRTYKPTMEETALAFHNAQQEQDQQNQIMHQHHLQQQQQYQQRQIPGPIQIYAHPHDGPATYSGYPHHQGMSSAVAGAVAVPASAGAGGQMMFLPPDVQQQQQQQHYPQRHFHHPHFYAQAYPHHQQQQQQQNQHHQHFDNLPTPASAASFYSAASSHAVDVQSSLASGSSAISPYTHQPQQQYQHASSANGNGAMYPYSYQPAYINGTMPNNNGYPRYMPPPMPSMPPCYNNPSQSRLAIWSPTHPGDNDNNSNSSSSSGNPYAQKEQLAPPFQEDMEHNLGVKTTHPDHARPSSTAKGHRTRGSFHVKDILGAKRQSSLPSGRAESTFEPIFQVDASPSTPLVTPGGDEST